MRVSRVNHLGVIVEDIEEAAHAGGLSRSVGRVGLVGQVLPTVHDRATRAQAGRFPPAG